jgi:hypothetical protein
VVPLIGTAFLLSGPLSALAQGPVPFSEDTHAFRFILNQRQLTPLSNLNELVSAPAKTILIVFGQADALDRIPGGLKGFVNSGGAVLVATDRRTEGSLRRDYGTWVTGQMVKSTRPHSGYRESPDCPLVRPLADKTSSPFRTLLPVATNKPSYLRHEMSELPLLAKFPPGCAVVGRGWNLPDAWVLYFAVGRAWEGKGRILVLADHSVFINLMMLQRDNGNFDLAFECVEWLTEGGKRNRVLLIDEGRVIPDFTVPLQSVPDLPISPVELANSLIGALEDDNVFNKLILESFSLRQVMSGWVIALTVALILYGFYRVIRAGYHLEPGIPLVANRLAKLAPPATVVDLRHASLLETGNLWEAARDVARQCLSAGGYDPSFTTAPPAPPRITVAAGWGRRRALRAGVRQLWRLVHDPRPRPISRRQFGRLLRRADDIQAAVSEGILHLDGSGERA